MRPSHFWTAIFSAVVFVLSFRVNQLLDAHFVYAAGISLLFIPAGVKLLLLLLGRFPAYVGLLASGTYLGAGIWSDRSMVDIVLFAFVGLTNYAVAAFGLMKLLHIDKGLANLRYWHIVLLSAVASVLNGVVHNLIYISHEITLTEEFASKALAMTFGDFMGCFVTVGLFHTVLLWVQSRRTSVAP